MSIAIAVKHMMAAGMPAEAICAAVAEMEATATRSSAAIRQERYRHNKASQTVTSDACDGEPYPPLPPLEVSPIPPSKTPPISPNPINSPERELIESGCTPEAIRSWKEVRKAKRAGAITPLVLSGLRREAEKAGLSVPDAVRVCCEKGWQNLTAEWLRNDRNRSNGARAGPQPTFSDLDRMLTERIDRRATHARPDDDYATIDHQPAENGHGARAGP